MAVTLQGLRTLIHPVEDLEAAKAWWTDFLGFGPYFDEPFYVGYEVAGYELATEHTPASEVGEGIVTGTVRNPQGSIVGFIRNPHFTLP